MHICNSLSTIKSRALDIMIRKNDLLRQKHGCLL